MNTTAGSFCAKNVLLQRLAPLLRVAVPSAKWSSKFMKMSAWTNYEKLRMAVCHFTLELEYYTPPHGKPTSCMFQDNIHNYMYTHIYT